MLAPSPQQTPQASETNYQKLSLCDFDVKSHNALEIPTTAAISLTIYLRMLLGGKREPGNTGTLCSRPSFIFLVIDSASWIVALCSFNSQCLHYTVPFSNASAEAHPLWRSGFGPPMCHHSLPTNNKTLLKCPIGMCVNDSVLARFWNVGKSIWMLQPFTRHQLKYHVLFSRCMDHAA